jgi:pyruvate dehydrogenase E1 component beta subunit
MDIPASENGITGIALGSALVGMRPVLTHQRLDFALLSMEQIVNQAAKWHYTFSGAACVPMVIRMITGLGWGQGPQHSQSLQAWFAHIPGLKVVMPATPYDAKGLLIASIRDNNPVVFLEHRWLYNISGPVPEGMYTSPLGKARVVIEGTDATIAATSYMVVDAVRAARLLEEDSIRVEVVDIRTLRPLDEETILTSVGKTGRLVAADTGVKAGGFAGEILALASERVFGSLKCAPVRVALPDHPIPTTPALANLVYPRPADLANAVRRMLGMAPRDPAITDQPSGPLDVPDPSFSGPF